MITDEGYFQDMKVIDERLTSLEEAVVKLVNILTKLEEILLQK